MAADVSTNVRMYRIGELGDCFLLSFSAGGDTSRVLIDCGSYWNRASAIARLKEITADIETELDGKPLDVVVGTHQHADHLSGFVHCEPAFRRMQVEQVWLPWLDDPADRTATKIGKAHNNLRLALFDAAKVLMSERRFRGLAAVDTLDGMLGFFGAKGGKSPPELPANAIKFLKGIGRKQPDYLKPGQILDLPGLPAGAVKVYVLGPPRNEDLLYRKDPRKGESYDHALMSAAASAQNFLNAVANQRAADERQEQHYPFSDTLKVKESRARKGNLKDVVTKYRAAREKWRTIDDAWLDQAESLALFMDTYTNNSSLVLAFELVESKKVLLFAADAQTGNWLSWSDVKWTDQNVKTDDLLSRTVLYKAGHHGSHNSTLVGVFEKMTHPDLSVVIPVDKSDPMIKKTNGWKMPARNLFRRMAEKASNRVLQMDNKNPESCDLGKSSVRAAWQRAGIRPKVTPLYIDLTLS